VFVVMLIMAVLLLLLLLLLLPLNSISGTLTSTSPRLTRAGSWLDMLSRRKVPSAR